MIAAELLLLALCAALWAPDTPIGKSVRVVLIDRPAKTLSRATPLNPCSPMPFDWFAASHRATFRDGSGWGLRKGQTTAHVRIEIGNGVIVTSSITNEAVDDLGLKVGDSATAIIKASDVMVATS